VIHFAALAYWGNRCCVRSPTTGSVAGLVNVLEAMLRHGTPSSCSRAPAQPTEFRASCRSWRARRSAQSTLMSVRSFAGEQILADARAALGLRVAMLRQRRRTRDRSCGPRPRFVWWGNNPLSLVHPTARRARMCQLFQACRICFNMTGIRFSPKAGIPAHTVSSRMIRSAPLESGL
jgi:hypothetical protein